MAAVVQSQQGTFKATSGVITLAQAPTPGNLLMLFVAHRGNAVAPSSVVESNVTWFEQTSVSDGTNSPFGWLSVFEGIITGTPGTTVTINLANADACCWIIVEMSGVQTSTDQHQGDIWGFSAATTTMSVQDSGSKTRSDDVDFICGFAPTNSAPTAGPDNGFSSLGSVSSGDATQPIRLVAGWKQLATSAQVTGSWTFATSMKYPVAYADMKAIVNATVTAPPASATASAPAALAVNGVVAVPARATATFVVPPVITGSQLIQVPVAQAVASRVAPHTASSRVRIQLVPDVGGDIDLVEDTHL